MRRGIIRYLAATIVVLGAACRPTPGRSAIQEQATPAVPATPLVLAEGEGERRVRRTPQALGISAPFILKVDGRNGGSQDLVMGYEDIPPGQAISPHRHTVADEIIFVHRGSGVVELGARTVAFSSGATIYIPKQVRIAVRNTGTEPVSIAFVFSKPGFEEYLRDSSVPEGQPVVPLTPDERRAPADPASAPHHLRATVESRGARPADDSLHHDERSGEGALST